MAGYSRRFASNQGQFFIQNSLKAAGDAALGYEPRYDLCRCDGLWRRTQHAILRNFVTYDARKSGWRPQTPLYGAAFLTGAIASRWKPGSANMWTEGGYAMARQVGWGALSNFLSEFSQDVGKKLVGKH